MKLLQQLKRLKYLNSRSRLRDKLQLKKLKHPNKKIKQQKKKKHLNNRNKMKQLPLLKKLKLPSKRDRLKFRTQLKR